MSEGVKAAPGDIISETKHATSYNGATAATFEGEGVLPPSEIASSQQLACLSLCRVLRCILKLQSVRFIAI